jgi:hypothetical protein
VALCDGLINGVLNQLQTNGLILSGAVLHRAPIGDEARQVLKFTGAACGVIEPKLALIAFLDWAKAHPELGRRHGISGVASAIEQVWPYKE